MQKGSQAPHHLYIKRQLKDGKWVYDYANASKQAKSFAELGKRTTSHVVVIAHGKPTQILVHPHTGMIASGPPNILGKHLSVNMNPNKGYFGVARDVLNPGNPEVYLYPESYLKKAVTKKAAKLEKAIRALDLVDREAEVLMNSNDGVRQDYGLAMWLNNHTQMRIGSSENAESVDPKERAKIIMGAKERGLSDTDKHALLAAARKQTYGLLTLRTGHYDFDPNDGGKVIFRFLGKGGKDNLYVAQVPFKVRALLLRKKLESHGRHETKIFHDDVSYKKIWRTYTKYGITPHASRGAYADSLIRQMMTDFSIKDGESGKAAERRFNEMVQQNISDRLNHTRSMTEKSYLTPTAQQALREFRTALTERDKLQESEASDMLIKALPQVMLWLELGAGNTVI